jgi:hypothetical protein
VDASHVRIAQVSKRLGLRSFEWSGVVGLRRRLTLRFPAPAARWAASVPTGPLGRGSGSGVSPKAQSMVGGRPWRAGSETSGRYPASAEQYGFGAPDFSTSG